MSDYTKLLLHCDGADESTTIIDSAQGHTMTAVSTAELDTAVKVFGTAALLLDGTAARVTTPTHADWAMGTGDFTIDFRVRLDAKNKHQHFFQMNDGDANNYWLFRITNDNKLYFYWIQGGTVRANFKTTGAPTINVDTFYHIEMSRNGSTCLMFVDGVSQAVTQTTAFGTLGDVDCILNIGGAYTGTQGVDGWMDEIRISKGICRHTSNFTPLTVAYDILELEAESNIVISTEANANSEQSLAASTDIILVTDADVHEENVLAGSASIDIVTALETSFHQMFELAGSAGINLVTSANITLHQAYFLAASADIITVTGSLNTKEEALLKATCDLILSTTVDVHEEAILAGSADIEIITAADILLAVWYSLAGSASIEVVTAITNTTEDRSLGVASADISVVTDSLATKEEAILQAASDIVLSTSCNLSEEALLAASIAIILSTDLDVHEEAILTAAINIILSTTADLVEEQTITASADIVTSTSASIWRWLAEIPPLMNAMLIDPYQGGAWLWLAEVSIPGYATMYIAGNPIDVTYAENTYTKDNLKVQLAPLSGDGSIPRDMMEVAQDVAYKLEDKINASHGAGGGTVKIIRVHKDFLVDHITELERLTTILTTDSDTNKVVFQLGIPDPLLKKIPLRRGSSKQCPYATPSLFKGIECQYAGADPTCTGYLSDCETKGNAVRWGGDISLDPSVAKV